MHLGHRAAGTLVAVALVASGTVLSTQTAHAGTKFYTVTVVGHNGCGGAQSVEVIGELNTQVRSWRTGTAARNDYSVTFTNVPAGGGWAWFVVHCGVSNNSNRWVEIRPGGTIRSDFAYTGY